jgi:hypothetical protein
MKTAKNRFGPLSLPVTASEPNISGLSDGRGQVVKQPGAWHGLVTFLRRALAQARHA